MANTFVGRAIVFGTGSTTATVTGSGVMTLLQSADATSDADTEQIKDASGNTATLAFYDHKVKATVEFIPSITAGGTMTITSLPSAGVTLALTDSVNAPLSGTWVVESCQDTASNTKAVMLRISLAKYLQNSLP